MIVKASTNLETYRVMVGQSHFATERRVYGEAENRLAIAS